MSAQTPILRQLLVNQIQTKSLKMKSISSIHKPISVLSSLVIFIRRPRSHRDRLFPLPWSFTKHFLEYVEFLYYLKRYGYDDYFTSDTSPTRWDITGTFEANSRLTNKIWQRLDEVDGGKFARLMAAARCRLRKC